ncbi:polyprenyl synthetase family protein [Schaalia naturae]|uniref:Polyprenyl synthetase family protein n=1 Tax=Schaalia naturae TaxID=635203 RepID=A0ABW2SKB3_9ACTO
MTRRATPSASLAPSTALAPTPEALAPRISAATARHLEGLGFLPGQDGPGAELTRAASAAVRGGKRVRGYLVFLGWTLARGIAALPPGDEDAADSPVDSLAAALELYQASALVHDDIIDHADMRRGRPTTRVALTAHHRRSGWAGSSAVFGDSGAILTGDLLLSAADHAVAEAGGGLPPEAAVAVLRRFTAMHAEVAVGQYLDLRAEQQPLDPADPASPTVEGALEVARLKSARYSVVHPAVLGILAGQGGSGLVEAAEAVLGPWGLAFQLRDDDLGVFGDPRVTGKPAGDDLREGKRTALLALAWSRATEAERRLLAEDLGRRDTGDAGIARMAEILAVRGRGAHEALIADLVEEGRRCLDAADPDPEQRSLLEGLGDLLALRRL